MIQFDIKELIELYKPEMHYIGALKPTLHSMFPAYQLIIPGTNDYNEKGIDKTQYDLTSFIWMPFPKYCEGYFEALEKSREVLLQMGKFNRSLFKILTDQKYYGYETLKQSQRVSGIGGGVRSKLHSGQITENNFIVLESSFSVIKSDQKCCFDEFDLEAKFPTPTWKQ
jgi:hypothetical protein